jgi:hypothetical protein
MKIKTFASYLAVGVALVASSAASTYAASLSAASAVLSGNPNITSLDDVINQVLQDPSVLNNPSSIGFPNSQQDFRTSTTSPIASAVSTGNTPVTGTTLTGNASSRAIYTSSGIELGSKAEATLDPGTTASVNGAIGAVTIADNIIINSLSQPSGTPAFVRLGLSIDASPDNLGALAGALISVNNTNASNTFNGNTELVSNAIPITLGNAFDVKLGFASVVGLPGGLPITISGIADFGSTAKLTTFQVTDSNGNPITDISAIGTTGVNFVTAVNPVPFEPSPTLGLLLLGVAWSIGSQVKKLNLANNKDKE